MTWTTVMMLNEWHLRPQLQPITIRRTTMRPLYQHLINWRLLHHSQQEVSQDNTRHLHSHLHNHPRSVQAQLQAILHRNSKDSLSKCNRQWVLRPRYTSNMGLHLKARFLLDLTFTWLIRSGGLKTLSIDRMKGSEMRETPMRI